MSEFKREHDRYIVIKRKDLLKHQAEDIGTYIDGENIRTRECVVVESDWPIYETVWGMVQRLAEGKTQLHQEMNQMLMDQGTLIHELQMEKATHYQPDLNTELVQKQDINALIYERDNLQGELKEAATLIAKQSETITKLKQDNDNYQLLVPSLDKLVKYVADKQLGNAGEDAADVIIRYCEKLRRNVDDPNPEQSGWYKIISTFGTEPKIAYFSQQTGWSFVAVKERFPNVHRVLEMIEV